MPLSKSCRIRFWRQNPDVHCCFYCGYEMSETSAECNSNQRSVDHIICTSKGGTNHPKNLIGACQRCNQERGDDDFIEFGIASILKNSYNVQWKRRTLIQQGRKERSKCPSQIQNTFVISAWITWSNVLSAVSNHLNVSSQFQPG